MVAFHLAYIGDTYAYAKAIVYTFHMPIFLAISGYLFRQDKTIGSFFQAFTKLLRIYLVFGTCYLCASYFLPVREHLGNLTIQNLAYHLFLKPIGPFWYLHSLLILHLISFLCFRLLYGIENNQRKLLIYLITLFSSLWIIAVYGQLINLESVVFYFLGQSLKLLVENRPFSNKILPNSFGAIIPLALLCSEQNNLSSLSVMGLIIIILICMVLIRLNQFTKLRFFRYLGKHSLYILLFSPIFTLLVKYLQAYLLAIDPSAILFLLLGTGLAIILSLFLAKIIHYLQRLSGIRFF